MRAVAIAVGIIIIAVIAMQMGMCQGETACVRECQTSHCKAAGTGGLDCSSDAFRGCAKACREAQH
jgi:hypothetical protein